MSYLVSDYPSYTNGIFSNLTNNFGYILFTSNSSLTFNKNTYCDILLVGAGGRGGIGSYSGGGGAGEVIYYPSFQFSSNIYNINIGFDSIFTSNRISKITLGTNEIAKAYGGGDGAYYLETITATNINYNVNNSVSAIINEDIIIPLNIGNNIITMNNNEIIINSVSYYKYLPILTNKPYFWGKLLGDGNDSVSNNYNFISVGTPIFNSSSVSLSSNNYLTLSNDSNMNLYTIWNNYGITISLWVKLSSTSGNWARIFDFSNGTNPTTNFLISKNGTTTNLQFRIGINGVFTIYNTTGINYFNNNWYHIVWSISSIGKWNIYINNILLSNNLNSVIPNITYTNRFFGRSSYTNDGWLIGEIKDFRIYRNVLNNTDISELYTGKIDIIQNANYGGSGGGGYYKGNFLNNRYIPKLPTSITTEVNNRSLNNITCYGLDITLDSSNIYYGSGTYKLYYSSIGYTINNSKNPHVLFNFTNNLTSDGGHFQFGTYDTTTGNFLGTNYLIDSNYKGEWIVINFPSAIILNKYIFTARNYSSAISKRAPKKFRIYGSNDGISWTILDDVDITDITIYTNYKYEKKISNTISFSYYCLTINALFTNNGNGVLNFVEIEYYEDRFNIFPTNINNTGSLFDCNIIQLGSSFGTPYNNNYSIINYGSDGLFSQGGNGGSALLTSNIIKETTTLIILNDNNYSYSINYQTIQNLVNGNYSATFNNGSITFNSVIDNSYPILKNQIFINSTDERLYPPKVYNNSILQTTSSGKILNVYPTNYYKETIILSTENITYGSGNYNIYSSSAYQTRYKTNFFDKNLTTLGGWGFSMDINNGYYSSSGLSSIISDYTGDWLIIELPVSIILTKYRFYRNVVSKAPALWRFYGSIDGINWIQIIEASNDVNPLTSTDYPNSIYEKILSPPISASYKFFGFTIKKVVGNDNTILLNEIELFGKEVIEKNINNINPIIWYKFNDSSTQMLLDNSGTYNLTNNGATFDTINFIKGNGSVKFDNSLSQYLSIPSINLYNIQSVNGITFSLWFRMNTTDTGSYPRIFDFNNNNTTSPLWIILSRYSSTDNRLCFDIKNSINPSGNKITTNNYIDGNWHHVIWSINNIGKWTIYIDGIIANFTTSLPTNINIENIIFTNNNFGKSIYNYDGYLSGNLDDFRIYNQVLTTAQVLELYNGRITILYNYFKNLTLQNLSIGSGGIGATSNSIPSIKTNFGDGGDGNGGLGYQGAVIIKFPFENSIGNSNFLSNMITMNDKNNIFSYWNDIKLKPSFCNICFSASYNDIIFNKPNLNSLSTSSNLDYSSNSFYSSFSNINYITSNNLIIFNNNKLNNLNSSLWITNSNNIYSNLGSIGIGTSSFGNDKLIIKGNLKADDFKIKGLSFSNIFITSNTFDNKSNNIYTSFSNLDYNSKNKQITSSQFITDINKNLFINYYTQYNNSITSTCNSLILSQNSIITFNYTNIFNVNSGTYNINFSNGSITFGSLNPDKSYPILKDTSGNTINPTAWYKFDDNTNLGKDEFNNYNLTNNNNVSFDINYYVKGIGSSAYNGTNQSLSGILPNLNNKSFTICGWFKCNINESKNLFGLYRTAGWTSRNTLNILTHSFTGTTYIIRYDFFGDNLDATFNLNENLNWNHYCFMYNYTNNNMRIYKNGIKAAEKTSGGAYNSGSSNSTYIIGGAFNYLSLWKGNIDDFRIYDRILTDTQILELYNGRVDIFSSNKYFSNVGIGTSSIENDNLTIYGNLNVNDLKIKNSYLSNILITSNILDNSSNILINYFNSKYLLYNSSNWITNNSSIYLSLNGNIGIGSTIPKEKIDINGNLNINGNILPNSCNLFNLGSSNLKWRDLYLSGNSIYLDDISIKNSNNYLSLSNININQIIFKNSKTISLNTNGDIMIGNKYLLVIDNRLQLSNIVLSNVFSNTSNSLLTLNNSKYNSFNSTDKIPIGINNRFITNDIYNRQATFTGILQTSNLITSNLNITGDYTIFNTTIYQTKQLFIQNSCNYPSISVKQVNINKNVAEFYNQNNQINFIINSNGNIGIGSANPSYKLDVIGTTNSTGLIINNNEIINQIKINDITYSNSIINNLINSNNLFTTSSNSIFNISNSKQDLFNSSTILLGIGSNLININYSNIFNPPNLSIYSTSVNSTSNSLYNNLSNINIYSSNSNINYVNNQTNNLIKYDWFRNNNNLYTNSNVGIGSTIPSTNLDISGNINTNELLIKKGNFSNIFITSNVFENRSNNYYSLFSNQDYNSSNININFVNSKVNNQYSSSWILNSNYLSSITSTCNSLNLTQNSLIKFNYTNDTNINSGTYNIIFNNGSITFGSLNPDKSYPILKNVSGNNINPILWYKFDGSSTNMLLDSIGTYNLTNNGATFDTTNFIKGNGSVNFNHSFSQYLSVPSINLYNIQSANGITFSLWFRMNTTNTGPYPRIFDFTNGNSSSPKWILLSRYSSTDNRLNFDIANSTNSSGNRITTNNYIDGNWHHVIWSINNVGNWTIYIDGTIAQFTATLPTNINIENITFTSNSLGKSLINGDGYLSGNIDDFRIYNQVLTQSQVTELYNGRVDIFSTNIYTNSNILILDNINNLTTNISNLHVRGDININGNIKSLNLNGNNIIVNYSNIQNRPYLLDLLTSSNLINISRENILNFPLSLTSWKNEWFVYTGTSPTNIPNSFIFHHITPTINSRWWFNGTIASTKAEISDERIKKNINNISNGLEKLMLLNPKEYYLCDDRDYKKKYGIIAQDVYKIPELNHLVYKEEDYIANVYSFAFYNNSNNIYIISSLNSIKNLIYINDELKILLDNNQNSNKEIIIEELPYQNRYKKRYVKVKNIIDDYSFEIYDDIEINEDEKIRLFIYGKKINDFHKLDYNSLYTLNIKANQEIYDIINNTFDTLNNLTTRIKNLEDKLL